MKQKLSSKAGFTLIELTIVMGLLGVLIGGVIFIMNPLEQLRRGRDVARKNDLAQMQRVIEQYYNDFGIYPGNDENYVIVDNPDDILTPHPWGTPWSPYIDVLPKDPVATQQYVYSSDGQTYVIYAHLERENRDLQVCNTSANMDCDNVPAPNACGAGLTCNFGVSSPNASP